MAQGNHTKDEQAVMRVVDAELQAYIHRDFDAYQRAWAHEPFIRRLGWCSGGGVNDVRGWDDLERRVLRVFREHPLPNLAAAARVVDNLVIRMGGTMASVTFDHRSPEPREPGQDVEGPSREGRVLQYLGGAWRIIYLDYVHQTVEPVRAPMFRVDRSGIVSWMNASAEAELRRAETLRLVGGRLTAQDPRDTQQIRGAIQQASDRDGALAGGRARIPILLRQGESDAFCVCWIVTEGTHSGTVLVTLNALTFTQDKLDAATAVFGFSQTQQRMAELIASGNDLSGSATQLGITVNTGKTHLQRIYDKTGVRSQAALVRTLLSIERPE